MQDSKGHACKGKPLKYVICAACEALQPLDARVQWYENTRMSGNICVYNTFATFDLANATTTSIFSWPRIDIMAATATQLTICSVDVACNHIHFCTS